MTQDEGKQGRKVVLAGSPILFRSAAEIAEALGVYRKRIKSLVEKNDFPAWKEDGRWKALPHEVVEWLENRRISWKNGDL